MKEIKNIIDSVFEGEINEIKRVQKNLSTNLEKAILEIYNSQGKVVVTGIGKTGIIGHKISASLASTGTASVFMNSSEGLHGDLGMVNSDDVVLAISNSGNSPEINGLIPSLRKIGCTIISITGNTQSKLALSSDIVINSHVEKEVCPLNLAPTTSTTVALVIGDAIVVSLLELRKFKPTNFALYHPGGSLGRRLLTTVETMIIPEKEIAITDKNSSLLNVVTELTKKNFGVVCVIEENKLVGIITDGDIRRALKKYTTEFFIKKAIDIMTQNFTVVSQNELAVDALSLLEEKKIGCLPVMDKNNNFIGIVRYQELFEVR
jgi:arabinose-5-phosphate isomerase